ncbi:beta-fructofuranosidase, insoluble isoenzyme CWINV1-like [Momordica charantia]|uniref:Beta-fructofuranosidase, insoluble isoenzyme CWINV1-like n=1 Tax=Momordica charantia TaxID=3673 RepID=A0A6J1DM23_MOMCH|nr:beta-fructofuranosidase, insoluble isoenzyme CWINV1-like [Momordica charantia]
MASFSLWFFSFLSVFLCHGVFKLEASHHVYRAQTSASVPPDHQQPYRTSYHFQPPKNWMNDPNGPMIYKGIYHLFYQYNPKGAVWGNIVWAHSTSTDLINWVPHQHAIFPSQPSDINGCWSGSATILPGNKPAMLYTGINPQNHQVQNLAVPKNLSDPFLIEWVKSPKNPLMAPTPQNNINSSSFRDPTTAWLGRDRQWRVVIGSKINARGLAIMYRSKDFIQWDQVNNPLHYADDTGMWECPDFFPVAKNSRVGVDTSVNGPRVKHVLKVSLDDTKHDHYTVGTYNVKKDVYVPDKGSVEGYAGLRYDYGKCYASKTFFDSEKKRRVLWGWVNESSSVDDDKKKGWSGVQAIPRSIWLDASGKQLVQWPIVEIQKLRKDKVKLINKVLKKGSVIEVKGVTAAQVDVEVSFKVKNFKKAQVLKPEWKDPQLLCAQKGAAKESGVGPFGLLLLASKDLKEYTSVFFKVFKREGKYVVLMCSDQSRSSLNSNNDKTTYGAFVDMDPVRENLSLRSLIDHSIVESFGVKGKACITARVYPTLAIGENVGLYAFNNATEGVTISKLTAWSLNKAHIN